MIGLSTALMTPKMAATISSVSAFATLLCPVSTMPGTSQAATPSPAAATTILSRIFMASFYRKPRFLGELPLQSDDAFHLSSECVAVAERWLLLSADGEVHHGAAGHFRYRRREGGSAQLGAEGQLKGGTEIGRAAEHAGRGNRQAVNEGHDLLELGGVADRDRRGLPGVG